MDQDQLSSLPEALLTHILSFLETKESVSTSVLSTRWKSLFAFVPVLDFHISDPCPNPEEFVKFINRVLSLHDVSFTLRKFHIDMRFNHPCKVSDAYSWINAAIRRHAHIIDISVRLNGLFTLPNDLFTCQVLVNLKLCGRFVFDVTGSVSLPSLKTIHISRCLFSNEDSAMRFFSSCPVLEELCLSFCDIRDICVANVISISVPSLKLLSISCGYSSLCEWELKNVPNLDTINLFGSNTTKLYSVNILKSLRHASIMIVNDDITDMIRELLNKFEEVQILSLSGNWIESPAKDPFSLPMFNKLRTLKLNVDFYHGWKFFPILLERSSHLEHLTIDRTSYCDERFLEIDILLPEDIPLCFSLSLKKVKFNKFKGEKVEYEWLGYLLKNAKVLEKLIVSALSVNVGEDDIAYLEKVRKNLLTLPRDSKNCQILVIEKGV